MRRNRIRQIRSLILVLVVILVGGPFLAAQEANEANAGGSSGEEIDYTAVRPGNNVCFFFISNGSLISLGYERLLIVSEGYFIAGGLALGYSVEPFTLRESYWSFPHQITMNLGRKRSFFEFGLGGNLLMGMTDETEGFFDTEDRKYIVFVTFGYRFQPVEKERVMFKIGISLPIPFTNFVPDEVDTFFWPGGYTVGLSF